MELQFISTAASYSVYECVCAGSCSWGRLSECWLSAALCTQLGGSDPASRSWASCIFSCALRVPRSRVCASLCSASLLTLNCQTSCCCLVAESCLSFVTPWTAACQGSVSFTIPWSLLRFMSIELLMLSNHLILCCPLFLRPSIFPSIRVFFSESAFGIRWPKYWSFNFSISPSNEYSGLISFRIDWFDLLTDQGSLKSLLQHLDSKTSVWCSAFIVQLSHPLHDYWKNHSFEFLVGIEEYLMAAFVCVSLLASKVKHLFTPFSAI